MAAGAEFGFGAGHAAADEIGDALVEVELEFIVEGGGCLAGAEGVGDT